MKVTLRQAHKLVEKINARLATIKLSAVQPVSIWLEEDPQTLIDGLRKNLTEELNRQLLLCNIRQEIRAAIQAVNASEVNGLVTARKGLLDQLATYRHLQATLQANTIDTAAALKAKMAAERNVASAGARNIYSCSDTVSVSLYDETAVKALDDTINKLQLRLEALEDQLTTANSVGQVALSDGVASVLRREGIIQ